MNNLKENKKPIVIIIITILAILAAVVIIKPFGGGGDSNTPNESVQVNTAVYAVSDILEGTVITGEMIEVKEVDEGVDVDAFKNETEVIGTEALTNINEGSAIEIADVEDPAREEMLEQNESGLSRKVPDGLRAILMPTGPVQEIVDYLEVGDRVDLIITNTKGDGFETSTPFKDVEVLMLGQGSPMPVPQRNPEEGEEGQEPQYMGGGSDVSSVVLAMTPEQSESISNMRISGVLETVQITIIGNGNK